MGDIFTTLDLVVFIGSLVVVMAVGLWAGRKEDTSEDYFLAGKQVPWWGVAGSIFGSNVSANHVVGMVGIGASIGFAQSHFELGAIAGLMLLCYGFLPVYRKLNLYTLSEYLSCRYSEGCRVLYALVMVLIMAGIQLVPAFYVGSRSLCVLLGGDAVQEVAVEEDGAETKADAEKAGAENDPPADPAAQAPPKTRLLVNYWYYALFIVALAAVTGTYTVIGGLKAVIWTDVIQSVLLLAGSIVVAVLVFSQPEVGGWTGMLANDAAAAAADQKMHLYLPTNHKDLPWTGAFTGLMALHFFYWGTNQFIVQRALGARSDAEGRRGIVAAGFLKLLIPFFAIGAGIAGAQLLNRRLADQAVDPDAVFPTLVTLVVPLGYGIVGLISAGLIGAILSTIDSMMNSAATIVTIDVYQRYVNPEAGERRLIWIGRISIIVFLVLAALLAMLVMDPNSKGNFFLNIAAFQSYLTPGLLAAFFLGMFWRRATAAGALAAIVAGPAFSFIVDPLYKALVATGEGETPPAIVAWLGPQLNFLHLAGFSLVFALLVHAAVSLLTPRDEEKEQYTWTQLGGHDPQTLKQVGGVFLLSLGVYATLAVGLYNGSIARPYHAAILAAAWTFGLFLLAARRNLARRREAGEKVPPFALAADDRLWAGLLCGAAVFMLFYYV